MGDFNWKQHIKESFKATFKSMPADLLSLLCFLLAMIIFFYCQTAAQLEIVQMLFITHNWMVIGTAFVGIAIFSFVIEKFLKGAFWLGTLLFRLLKK